MSFQIAEPYAKSPLSHRKPTTSTDGTLVIRESAHNTLITLRGEATVLKSKLADALPCALPLDVNTTSSIDGLSIACLSPDEWLIVQDAETTTDILAAATSALEGTFSQVVDVSDYYTIIEIEGASAADVLAKITSFDLRDRSFKPGAASNTRMAHATVTIIRKPDGPDAARCYRLIIRASMADYLWSLLTNGAQQFGIAPQDPRMGEPTRYGQP